MKQNSESREEGNKNWNIVLSKEIHQTQQRNTKTMRK